MGGALSIHFNRLVSAVDVNLIECISQVYECNYFRRFLCEIMGAMWGHVDVSFLSRPISTRTCENLVHKSRVATRTCGGYSIMPGPKHILPVRWQANRFQHSYSLVKVFRTVEYAGDNFGLAPKRAKT